MKYRIVEKQNKFGTKFHVQYTWLYIPFIISLWGDLSPSRYDDIRYAKNLIDRLIEQDQLDNLKLTITYHTYP